MAKIVKIYEAVNPDTGNTGKYKIVQDGSYYTVIRIDVGFFWDSEDILKYSLETESSARQIMYSDARKRLGNNTRVNQIHNANN